VKLQKIFLFLCCFTLASGIALAQKVNVQTDPEANFSNYKTYAWGPENNRSSNPMTDQMIMETIDAQLASHGLMKVQENPNLLVMYHTGESSSVQWNSFGGFRGFGMGSGNVYKVYTGQVVIDLVDPTAKKYVWQASASDTVSSDASKTQKEFTKAVTKIFSNFPNPPK
jgi:hypothetical protein